MTFFDRYAALCREKELDPCGKKIEQLIGINRTTANKWGANGTVPKGETVRQIADFFHVSADYLLGRTEDKRDYTTEKPALTEQESRLIALFSKLSEADRQEILQYCAFKASKE